MPHVARPLLLTLDAPLGRVRDAATRLFGLEARADGSLEGPLTDSADAGGRLHIMLRADDGTTTVALDLDTAVDVPYFRWFIGPLVRRARRRALAYAAARLRAEVDGTPAPRPPRAPALLPPVPFGPEAASLLATVAALAALANFGGALFGQNADSITNAFHASNRALGFALAVSRVGVLVSLVASALADRQGRRRLLLLCFTGVCIANGISALAPGFIVFTAAQLFARAFVNAALVIAAIAVVEEAPEGARAYALAMLALAGGAGFAVAVIFLPLSDLGTQSWRIVFALSALSIVFLPRLARNLRETRRYSELAARTSQRGRLREVFDRVYGFRFLLLGLAAFLTNVFSAPSAQLTNRYLSDEHAFSNTAIAVFRTVTNGLPGFIGIVIAGWLAESRGRRPLAIVALVLASLFQIAFFLGGGSVLWITSTLAIIAAACAGLALGAFDAEMFPTEVRGTSNALLLVCGVAGSATGLLLATNLDGVLGGLGRSIALCGAAPLIAALLVLPWLPESADRALDDVSPSAV
jgi:MFS family permease